MAQNREREVPRRVALVTGAASGIGEATARLLAEDGHLVYGADLTEVARAGPDAQPGQNLRSLRLDVRSEEDWKSVLDRIHEEEGSLHVLVHAAGVSSAAPLEETSLSEWRRVIATNLDGSFLAIKHALRVMKHEGGAIVLVGSASGIRPSAGAAAYSTSKAAVGMLVRAAAKECRDAGFPVRINAVSPAGVRTPIWQSMPFFRDLVKQHGSDEAAFSALEEGAGVRFAEPEEVAQVIKFLVSPSASHLHGVELPLDGGYIL